jgi:hypothetical protein
MKHMTHPANPDFAVEAPEGRAEMLAAAGWSFVKPGPDPKDDKPAKPE